MPVPSTQRDLRLDFFRGVSLILIFVDHIPENVLSLFTLQSICFFDAAEVFIFISGFTAALVYGRRLATKGPVYASAQVWRRAWQLYVAHIFLFVLFVAEVSYTAAKVKNPMYTEEMRVADFLEEPHIAVIKALTLQFQPVFLDILPMYILMLAIFPAVLLGLRLNWLLVVVPSVLVYAVVHLFDISVPAYPAGHVWFFNPLAWQLLFIAGAVLAYLRDAGHDFSRSLRVLYPIAAALFVGSVIVRVSWTLHTFWESVPPLLLKELWPADKTDLSPVRLIPFFALVVLVAARVSPTARFLSSPWLRPLVICGQQSLEIFCVGILLSALGHFVIGEYSARIPIQLAVNAAGIAIMIGTARIIDWYKRMDRLPVLQPAVARARGEGSAE